MRAETPRWDYFTALLSKNPPQTGTGHSLAPGLPEASLSRAAYKLRRKYLKEFQKRKILDLALEDEAAGCFYACHICTSYSPRQICVLRPEKPALCGLYDFRTAQVIARLEPWGPFRKVEKGRCLNPENGEWEGVNRYLQQNTGGKIKRSLPYSLLEEPEPVCSCAQVIAAFIPEAQGFMLVNREYRGETPLGMDFAALLEYLRSAEATPGFAGLARSYLKSPRFLKAEGGLSRLVWLPASLKRAFGSKALLPPEPGPREVKTLPQLLAYLKKVGHPVLTMENLLK